MKCDTYNMVINNPQFEPFTILKFSGMCPFQRKKKNIFSVQTFKHIEMKSKLGMCLTLKSYIENSRTSKIENKKQYRNCGPHLFGRK